MYILGIIGGICSGKSFVTKMLEQHGAKCVSADEAAHDALRLPNVIYALTERFGEGILAHDGCINRINQKALAAIVFSDEKAKLFLEQLTHPIIAEIIGNQLSALKEQSVPMAILDAPLLLEANMQSLCDGIVFVEANYETRAKRAAERLWSEKEWHSREAAQFPLEQKKLAANWVIENNGAETELQNAVKLFIASHFESILNNRGCH